MKWTFREEAALEKGLEVLGLPREGEIFEMLNAFASELILWNSTHGLVAFSDPMELVHRHILDSLAALPHIGKPETLADVGSGAGLPGIPLAICLKETRVFLIEKMGRRCDFLRNVVAVTGMSDRIDIIQSPLEKIKTSFDVVTLRAFAPLPRVIEPLKAITNPGGMILAYKGKKETFLEELNLEWNITIEALRIPGVQVERNLVIIS